MRKPPRTPPESAASQPRSSVHRLRASRRYGTPLAQSRFFFSNDLLEHLIILGGGYVGLEFAQAYRRFGSCPILGGPLRSFPRSSPTRHHHAASGSSLARNSHHSAASASRALSSDISAYAADRVSVTTKARARSSRNLPMWPRPMTACRPSNTRSSMAMAVLLLPKNLTAV